MNAGWTALIVVCAATLLGCGSSQPPPAPAPAPEPTERESAPPGERVDDSELEQEAPEPTPPISDAELDAMERGDLELACERGSTAACDRLGH